MTTRAKRTWIPLFATLLGCALSPAARFEGGIREGRSHFILVGDTQRTSPLEFRESNDRERRLVLDRIAGEDPAFLLILGDLVFQGDSERHWAWFDDDTAGIRERRIPVYPLFGNHEYFGDNRIASERVFARFPHLGGRRWNLIRFRSVAAILLDSNFSDLSPEEAALQDRWYRATLQSLDRDAAVRWAIVCCHHPPYTNSTGVSDDTEVQRRFASPFFGSPKARLFVSGHAHAYERFEKEGRTFVVSGGGGGPRQKLETARPRHRDLYEGGPIREFHYCRVDVEEGGALRVRMIRLGAGDRWEVGDEFRIN
jgi:Icc-related predicted phosphoesterase